jgi:hypothetical protein
MTYNNTYANSDEALIVFFLLIITVALSILCCILDKYINIESDEFIFTRHNREVDPADTADTIDTIEYLPMYSLTLDNKETMQVLNT